MLKLAPPHTSFNNPHNQHVNDSNLQKANNNIL